ncbi:Hpt domain-containing protein [Limibaculum sp. FT325]|uniref:Hpt domain-containing protein n=1 Tax=Thermohalobaculum sediminis TaxID=2939436 RepID=UPI0020BFF972|nr:Hpt domain-containing protein [Limibaculum sediminis]MCL5776930.1 Hpt domain-containing protein [Limibaculum sediminis]
MTGSIIDMSALHRLLDLIGGDPADLRELLADYRDIAPGLAAQIDSAARSGDLDTLRIAAHTLKSNARDFGAMRLSTLCEALERQCRDGALHEAASQAAAIVREEAAARQALDAVDIGSISE